MTTHHGSATVAHYSPGGLQQRIDQAIAATGLSPDTVAVTDLSPVDEFHVGGRGATEQVCRDLGLDATSRVIDIGSGIGGTARFLFTEYGCSVTGVDLTPEYVDVAEHLSALTCAEADLNFHNVSALDTGLAGGQFDAATQLHVGMNIGDKAALFQEVFRLLRPGATYVIYDLMGDPAADLTFPLPWATDAATSSVASIDSYFAGLDAAGFVIEATTDRTEAGLAAFEAQRQAAHSESGPSPLGIHLILGTDATTKIGNLVPAIRSGLLAPVEIRSSKPS